MGRNVQRADALGAADLMGAEAHEIHAQLCGGAGHFQKALYRIGVKKGAAFALFQHAGNVGEGEDAARFVIHQHDAHQHRVLAEGGFHLRGGHVTRLVGL